VGRWWVVAPKVGKLRVARDLSGIVHQHACNIKLLWFVNLNIRNHLNDYKSH
jgi:hypothetical protein